MRKCLLLFCLIICSTSTIVAQINSAPKGVRLNSTIAEVKKVLNDNGYEYSATNTKYGVAYIVKQFYFSNIKWDYMYIAFVDGKCASVLFTREIDERYISDCASMLVDFTEIVVEIHKIYEPYLVSENIDNIITRTYSDGETLLLLQGKFNAEERCMMSLSYSSNGMIERMMSSEVNEL